MTCIYCLEGQSATGRAHVIPEALAQNDWVLPLGAVCDKCNHYLGKLDVVLASHPLIALGVQWLRLPGKNRKVRQVVGNVEQAPEESGIHVPTRPPHTTFPPGGRQTSIEVLAPRTFNGPRFRRALHHVGLNLVALTDGPEAVLGPEFGDVRRYIRQPKPNERWAFAQMQLLNSISPEVRLLLHGRNDSTFVGLRLFAGLFWVHLHNTGDLEAFVREQESTPDLTYVGPNDRLPREGPKQGKKRYRMTILRGG